MPTLLKRSDCLPGLSRSYALRTLHSYISSLMLQPFDDDTDWEVRVPFYLDGGDVRLSPNHGACLLVSKG